MKGTSSPQYKNESVAISPKKCPHDFCLQTCAGEWCYSKCGKTEREVSYASKEPREE